MSLFASILRRFLLLAVLAATGTLAACTAEEGQSRLEDIISNFVSTPDRGVEVTGLSGVLSGELTVEEVVLADRNGPWLRIEDITVDWSPLSLFRRQFNAERISAARVELLRRPIPAEEQPDQASEEPFSLPVSLDIAAIELPQIVLEEEVAGQPAQLSATGSLVAEREPVRIESALNIVREDGPGGTLGAEIAFVPQENRLDIEVQGSEPAGGIIASLLNLPGEPAVEIAVSGTGSAAEWQGEGTFAVEGEVITRVSGTYETTDAGSRVELRGEGEFARFVPAVAEPLVAGTAMFDVAGTIRSGGRGFEIEGAVVESSAVRATAFGVVDLDGASDFTLELASRANPVPLTIGEGDEAISLALQGLVAHVSGPGGTPAIDANARLAALTTPEVSTGQLEITLESAGFDIDAFTGPATVRLTAEDVEQQNPTLQPLLAGPITVQAATVVEEELIRIESGTIDGAAVDGTVSGTIALNGRGLDLDISADVAASALPAAAQGPLGKQVELSASISRTPEGAIAAEELQLSSGPLSLTGSATLADSEVAAELSGTLADLGVLAPDASGAVAFQLSAEGPLSAPQVDATLTAERVEAAGRPIENLSLNASGVANLSAPQATVSLTGTVGGEPLEGSAVLSTENGVSRIADLALSLGENRIAGDLNLAEGFVPTGTLQLDIADLGPLAALALEEVAGALQGTVEFTAADGQPTIDVDATIEEFRRGEIVARGVVVDAVVTDYLSSPAISGRILAEEVVSGDTVVRGVELDLSREAPWTRFDGEAVVDGIPASAAGRLQVQDGVVTVELDSASATLRGIAASLASPSTIVVRDGTVQLDDLALSVGGGTATVSGTAGSVLDLDVRVSGLPAATANAFAAGLGAEGTISGTAQVSGAASSPNVTFDVDWANAATSQTRAAGFGALTLAADGSYANDVLRIDANAGGAGGLGLDGGGTIALSGSRALDLDFSGRVPFSFLAQRLAAQGLALEGAADLDVSVGGTVAAPSVNGTVRTASARFVDAGSGIAVEDISAELGLGGTVATLRSFTGTLSTGGTITAGGTIAIDPARGFPADLTLRIAEGRYTDGRVVTANFDGNLTITGPITQQPLLGGTINLARTVITLPERLPGTLARIDVEHQRAPAAVYRQAEAIEPAAAAGGGGGLTLDLTINAPQRIFVQGRGLDVELGGSLALSGPASSPVATGSFDLRRGRLSILGRRLDFSRGTLGFAGSLVPTLDLAATTTTSTATITVMVTGRANDPAFAFSSSPALPQDEVFAQLIFGRSMSDLSPLQIAQLAEAAAQLTGIGGSTSLLDSLQSALGVDDIDIKTDERTGETSVSVGKYLNDRTYLSIERGADAGSTRARIDLEVGQGLKLRGEAAEDGEAKAGIFFEREY